jgi:trk system potassium uptake protein TrkA
LAERTRSVAVIGLGAFGATVATELARMDNFVLGIDTAGRRVAAVADQIAEAKILDATDEAALREAGLGRFGAAVIAIGENVEASILAAMNARLLGCSIIWAKARDRTHHRILSKLGVDRVILPEQEVAQHVALTLNNPAVRDYIGLGNGFHVVDVEIPGAFAGRTIASLDLPERFDVRPLGLMRGSVFHGPDEALDLLAGDDLLLLGKRADLRRFGETF